MLRAISVFNQKMLSNPGSSHSKFGSAEIAESDRVYEPIIV
jgi:hypothetical protein